MKSRQDFATEKEWLDYYRHCAALAAMQGLLAAQAGTMEMVLQQAKYYAENYTGKTMIEAIALESVSLSDALINALNAPTP